VSINTGSQKVCCLLSLSSVLNLR